MIALNGCVMAMEHRAILQEQVHPIVRTEFPPDVPTFQDDNATTTSFYFILFFFLEPSLMNTGINAKIFLHN